MDTQSLIGSALMRKGGEVGMIDKEKIFDALRCCATEPKCRDCPWEDCEKVGHKRVTVPVTLLLDTLILLRERPEQKRGHWISYGNGYYRCSVCNDGKHMNFVPDYCSTCGAKMDEEMKQDD